MKRLSVIVIAVMAQMSLATDLLWSGDTTTGATWQRPSSLTAFGGNTIRFSAQEFHVSASGNYTLEASVSYPNGFIFLYNGAFNPAQPLTNLQDGDQYFNGTFSVLGGTVIGYKHCKIAANQTDNFNDPSGSFLMQGVTYTMVVTSNYDIEYGTFAAGIGGGSGNVIAGAVPEPATLACLGLGLAAITRRRRSR